LRIAEILGVHALAPTTPQQRTPTQGANSNPIIGQSRGAEAPRSFVHMKQMLYGSIKLRRTRRRSSWKRRSRFKHKAIHAVVAKTVGNHEATETTADDKNSWV